MSTELACKMSVWCIRSNSEFQPEHLWKLGKLEMGGQVQRRNCRVPFRIQTFEMFVRHLRGEVKQADCLLNVMFGKSISTYLNV